MTDIWDEINLDSVTYESDLDPLRVRTYLEKLKAEYDRLKGDLEHAKNQAQTRYQWAKELEGENIPLRQKLEAVKVMVDEWGRQRNDDYGLEYDWYYKEKYFKLKNILEAKG